MSKSKSKSKAGSRILQGAREALAFARGEADVSEYRIHVPPNFDVKKLRKSFGLSQAAFAERFGFTVDRVQDWEQGRSNPDSALRAYLIVIARERKAVERALTAKVKGDELERAPEYA
jgi:putative transcriptional regulator